MNARMADLLNLRAPFESQIAGKKGALRVEWSHTQSSLTFNHEATSFASIIGSSMPCELGEVSVISYLFEAAGKVQFEAIR